MRLIITEEQFKTLVEHSGFWGSAGAGCIILSKDTGRILLPLRSADVKEPGTWGTWGGAIDEGESPMVAAKREVEEESGYVGHVKIIPLHVFKHESGFKYFNFLAIVEHEFKPILNWETARARWFEIDELPKPLHFGLKGIVSNGNDMRIIHKYTKQINESIKNIIKETNNMTFLGYHATKSNLQSGYHKGDVLDPYNYDDVISTLYQEIIADYDENLENGDIEAMNDVFIENGYGFTYVSRNPIEATPYQASKYKYGDNLYKVYGDGSEIVLDDYNELGAEIIASKNPLYFEAFDLNESIEKTNLNESVYGIDIDYDVDFIYNKFFKEDVDEIEYNGGILNRDMFKPYETTTNILRSKECIKANRINPCVILINSPMTRNQNFYAPFKNLINLTVHKDAFEWIIDSYSGSILRAQAYPKNKNIDDEFKERKIKATIKHELTHWLDDTLHNDSVKKELNGINNEKSEFNRENIDSSYFEMNAQINAISYIKNNTNLVNNWDSMTFEDLMYEMPALKHVNKTLPYKAREKWIRNLKHRMHREGLLGKKMYNTNESKNTIKLNKKDIKLIIEKVLNEQYVILDFMTVDYVMDKLINSNNTSWYDIYPGCLEVEDEDEECMFTTKEDAIAHCKFVIDVFSSLPNPIPIYRTIKVEKIEDVELESPGESWSFSEDSAMAFGGHNGSNVLLSATIDQDYVNWDKTVDLFLLFSGNMDEDDENEINVDDEYQIKNIQVTKYR